MAESKERVVFGAEQWSAIHLPWLRFSLIFLSCKANARVFDAKTGHDPNSLPKAQRLHLSAWQTSHSFSMRQSQSGLGTQTANQPKFIPPILSLGNLGPSLCHDQWRPSAWLQNRSRYILPCSILGICYWVQHCVQTQEWLTVRGRVLAPPHPLRARQLSLWMAWQAATSHVFCCSDDKDVSVNRYNQIATPKKKSLISLRWIKMWIMQWKLVALP